MTTTVTVKTHDWPVKVTEADTKDTDIGKEVTARTETVVNPHSEQTFHVWDSRSVLFEELKIAAAAPAPEVADTIPGTIDHHQV